ncbi:hypothetical protein L3X38_030722 [Prunus dulcis]|uniref:Uncharacterized protein n=1 Tax=Prunus dulcis TaxID=3755 RepID=A0AAD4YUC0_PRUDU|nr:hypothetical protein L3X38_030722 [Prunus dulcis]
MFEAVAEFQGFLIAMSRHRKEFVAWKLDGNGIPHKYRVLHELRDVFCPFLYPECCYLGHLDSDGRMWFVYSSNVYGDNNMYLRVAMFRVSVSEHSVGNPILSADLEGAEYYDFNEDCGGRRTISSAFVLCHNVNENFKPKNLSNVESYDLTHDSTDEQGPSMSICQKHTIPSLIDPRIILGNKIMFNLEDKTYVLACQDDGPNVVEPPLFKVFYPCQQSWKDLPYPPFFKPHGAGDHFTWDHKVFFMRYNVAYAFDPHKEKWSEIKIKVLNSERFESFWVVAELQGFLIGMLRDRKELVAWKLDGDGLPQRHRVLHELGDIFSPFLIPEHCYLGHLDGEGRMWFVYYANVRTRYDGEPEGGYVRVAVFVVSISKDPVGNPVLSADLEAAEYYGFNYWCEISSACVVCHHVKENFKPRKFCGVSVPNRPYSQRRRKGKY